MTKENEIHADDRVIVERIHGQHIDRIGVLGDEAIKFQDASYAVGRLRGREDQKEQSAALLQLVQRMRSYLDQAGIDSKPESMNPLEKLSADINVALSRQ